MFVFDDLRLILESDNKNWRMSKRHEKRSIYNLISTDFKLTGDSLVKIQNFVNIFPLTHYLHLKDKGNKCLHLNNDQNHHLCIDFFEGINDINTPQIEHYEHCEITLNLFSITSVKYFNVQRTR